MDRMVVRRFVRESARQAAALTAITAAFTLRGACPPLALRDFARASVTAETLAAISAGAFEREPPRACKWQPWACSVRRPAESSTLPCRKK